MAGRTRWCDHIKPATALVACGGSEHRVTWRKGKVVLEDHDLASERAMLAFGGELPACLKVLQLWRNLHSSAMSIELFRQVQASLGPAAALLAPGELAARNQLGLMLTWERAWKHWSWLSEHGRLLHDHIRPEVLVLLREHLKFWMAERGCRRISSAVLEVPRGAPASLQGQMDTVGVRATASVGGTWVVQVWGRGMALVDGGFVLEVLGHDEHGAAAIVRAARWDEAEPGVFRPVAAPARVRRDSAGAWRLTWDPPELGERSGARAPLFGTASGSAGHVEEGGDGGGHLPHGVGSPD
ncbi:MAG: hypothetical protein M3P85_08995 [Actinomycetota bacterium]|nr:hypothetical protein [Actinomycetota bacterium]